MNVIIGNLAAMVRRKKGGVVQRIKQLAGGGKYWITEHALQEMDDDHLSEPDVLRAIKKGRLSEKLTNDPRGPRYVILGRSLDGRLVECVCRLVEDRVRILTVYIVE